MASHNKYGNIPRTLDGHTFPSQLEAQRYLDLKLLVKSGDVQDLTIQVPFDLTVGPSLIGRYVADFVYFETKTSKYIVEDAKGKETALFKWKWKHLKSQYRSGYVFRLWPQDYNNQIYERAIKKAAKRKATRSYFHTRGVELGLEKPKVRPVRLAEVVDPEEQDGDE